MKIIVGDITCILAGMSLVFFSGIFVNNSCEYHYGYFANIIEGIVRNIEGIICRYYGGLNNGKYYG